MMTIDQINEALAGLHANPSQERMMDLARMLISWLGLPHAEGRGYRALDFKEGLREHLVKHPLAPQVQFYRMTPDDAPVNLRLAVLKKISKKSIRQLIDKEVRMEFQNAPAVIQAMPSAPAYCMHVVSGPSYDGLYVVLHQGDQKRVLSLRRKLTQTQYQKTLPAWRDAGRKSKSEITALLWKSLDLKEVNKEFYGQIKERYDDLVGLAMSQQPKAQEQEVRQFAVRLIGRYIFCWFLKEKGIIQEVLLASDTVRAHRGRFGKLLLRKLFFETLNAEVSDPAREQTNTELDRHYAHIPYLNGGLFDRHAEDVLFDQLELDDWLLGFVDVLERFDFTVDESSSQYQLVAIDPEMLGRIFENLLATQNQDTEKAANQRKAFGAFYTPREIVDYMVNESLKAYLEARLLPPAEAEQSNIVSEPLLENKGTLFEALEPRQTALNLSAADIGETERAAHQRKRLRERIEKFVQPDCIENPFKKDEQEQVRKALREVTILDPACGSGAFPMGVLLRLVELRQIVGHGHKSNYDLKSEILSRSIYGVDIMPMAVEIARLRAWLSLVLEAEYKPQEKKNNFGIAALPNLDFKFICANSLVDSGYGDFLKKFRDQLRTPGNKAYLINEQIQRLQRIRDEYFDPKGDKARKDELRASFYTVKDFIKKEFAPLKKSWGLEDFLNKVDDWDPFNDSKPASFFSPEWMFGITEGFDVVIGNPPYAQVEKGLYSSKLFPYAEGLDPGKQNLYKLFVEASLRFSKPNGTNCLIVQSSLMCDLSSKYTRKLLINNSQIKHFIEFPKRVKNSESQVFESVLQGTCIYLLINAKPKSDHQFGVSTGNSVESINELLFEKLPCAYIKKLYPDLLYIPLIKAGDLEKLRQITMNSIPLLDLTEYIRQGDMNLSSHSDKFEGRNTGVPLFRGKHVHRFKLDNENSEFVDPGFKTEAQEENARHELILLQEVTGTTDRYRIHACLSRKEMKCLFGHTINKVKLKDQSLNKFVIGILNSRLIDWFFRLTSTNNHVMGYELEQLPIPKDMKNYQAIHALVEKVCLRSAHEGSITELQDALENEVLSAFGIHDSV